MNAYELTLVINPKLADKERETLLEKVYALVEKEGGKVAEKKPWGKKKLAYPVKKLSEGFYEFLTLELEPFAVKSIDKKIKAEENIIRYLLIKIDDR